MYKNAADGKRGECEGSDVTDNITQSGMKPWILNNEFGLSCNPYS